MRDFPTAPPRESWGIGDIAKCVSDWFEKVAGCRVHVGRQYIVLRVASHPHDDQTVGLRVFHDSDTMFNCNGFRKVTPTQEEKKLCQKQQA